MQKELWVTQLMHKSVWNRLGVQLIKVFQRCTGQNGEFCLRYIYREPITLDMIKNTIRYHINNITWKIYCLAAKEDLKERKTCPWAKLDFINISVAQNNNE